MTEFLLGIDVDNCLTDGWLHFGAVVFDDLWQHMPRPVRHAIYRKQKPRDWLVEVVQKIERVGPVCIVSQRREADTQATAEELARFGLPKMPMFLMDGMVSVLTHKAHNFSRCRFAIEDQEEIIKGVRRMLGSVAPMIWNSTRDADAIRAWVGG